MSEESSEQGSSSPKKKNGFQDIVDKTKTSWNKIPVGVRVSIVIVAFVGLSAVLGLAFTAGCRKPNGKAGAMVKRLVRDSNVLLRKAANNKDPVLAYGEACYAVDRLEVATELVGEAEAQNQTGVDVRELTFFAKELRASAMQNVYDKCPRLDSNDSPAVAAEVLPLPAKSRRKKRSGARLDKDTFSPPF